MSLDNAFRALREKGYFAKRNVACCQSCSWAEIPDEQADKAVFTHEQTEDNIENSGRGFLHWAGDGAEITEVLKDNGVSFDWDGSEDTAIKVYV